MHNGAIGCIIFAVDNKFHVVLEIDSGKNPYMETLEYLRALGWTESNQYSDHSDVVNEDGQDAGTYYYWDAHGEDAWVSDEAFPATQSWSVA
jgi:hypothetical protein